MTAQDAYEYNENPQCSHCKTNIIDREGYEATLCADCRWWADELPEIVTCCDGASDCGVQGSVEALSLTNPADTMAAFASWSRLAGKGVDPFDTYPRSKVVAGTCIGCALTRLNREAVAS